MKIEIILFLVVVAIAAVAFWQLRSIKKARTAELLEFQRREAELKAEIENKKKQDLLFQQELMKLRHDLLSEMAPKTKPQPVSMQPTSGVQNKEIEVPVAKIKQTDEQGLSEILTPDNINLENKKRNVYWDITIGTASDLRQQ